MKTANYKWNDKVENFNYKLNKLREELNKYKKNAIPESLSYQKNANTTKGKLDAKKREFSVIKNNEVLKNIYKRTNGGCALKDKKNSIRNNSSKKNPVHFNSGQSKYTYSGAENNSINRNKDVYNNSNNNIKQKTSKENLPNNTYRKMNKKNKSQIKENSTYYNTVTNRCLTSRSTYERNGTTKNMENKSLTTRTTNYEGKTKTLQLPTSRATNNKIVKTRTSTNTTNTINNTNTTNMSSNSNISNYNNNNTNNNTNNNNNNNSTITASATTTTATTTTNNNTTTTTNNSNNNNTATIIVPSNSVIPNGNDKKIMEYNKKYNEKKHHVTTKHVKINVLDNNVKKTNVSLKHRMKFLHFEEEDGNIQVYPVYADADVGFHNITHVDDDNLSQVKKENQDDDDIKTTKRLAEWSSELVYKHLEETIKKCKIVFKNCSIESRTDDLLRRMVE